MINYIYCRGCGRVSDVWTGHNPEENLKGLIAISLIGISGRVSLFKGDSGRIMNFLSAHRACSLGPKVVTAEISEDHYQKFFENMIAERGYADRSSDVLYHDFWEDYGLHYGLPILTSNLDFAQEICGDAAIYFDPWSPSAIKSSIQQAHSDKHLLDRLRVNGKIRFERMQLSWDQIASELLEQLARRELLLTDNAYRFGIASDRIAKANSNEIDLKI